MTRASWATTSRHPLLSAVVGAVIGGLLTFAATWYFYEKSSHAARQEEAFSGCQETVTDLGTLIAVMDLGSAKLAPEGGGGSLSINEEIAKASDAYDHLTTSLTKWYLSTSDQKRLEMEANPLLKASTDWLNTATMANPGTVKVLANTKAETAFMEKLRSQARNDVQSLEDGQNRLMQFCRDERPS